MNWFVLYTRPRFEKKVVKKLEENGYEVYLPLKKEIRQWSDRRKWVEEPIFRSYVFIKTVPEKLPFVTRFDGVVCPVTFNGKAAEIRDEEIRAIEQILTGPEAFDVIDTTFIKGEMVTITYGPLKGMKGRWVDHRGNKRIAIQIEELQKCLIIEVPAAYVEKSK